MASIEALLAQLKTIVTSLDRIERRLLVIENRADIEPLPVTDRRVRQDPPGWDGMSFEGALYSECPVGFLRLYVDNLRTYAERQLPRSPHRAAQAHEAATMAEAWLRWRERYEQLPSSTSAYDGRPSAPPRGRGGR